MSTSLNKPARTKKAFVATSSSATPGKSLIVPAILYFSISFFSTIAAVTFTALTGVVTFAVTGRAFDDGIVIGDAGFL